MEAFGNTLQEEAFGNTLQEEAFGNALQVCAIYFICARDYSWFIFYLKS